MIESVSRSKEWRRVYPAGIEKDAVGGRQAVRSTQYRECNTWQPFVETGKSEPESQNRNVKTGISKPECQKWECQS